MNILSHDINKSLSTIQKLNAQKINVNHEKSNMLMHHDSLTTLGTWSMVTIL